MNHLAITLRVAWAALLLTLPLTANENEEKEDMRINQLIPSSWIVFPYVEPAIPHDYTMREADDEGIIWGTMEDLQAFDSEKVQSKHGLFYLYISLETLQEGPNSFSNEFDEKSIKEISSQGYKIVEDSHTHWGDYPVRYLKVINPDATIIRRAWIGLNTPDQWVIAVIYYPTGNEKYDDKVWNEFLRKTKKLTGRELFLAKGVDMRDGYTLFNKHGIKMKAVAEKRVYDGKVAVLVTILDGKSRFSFNGIKEVRMAERWKYGEHLTVIEGEASQLDEEGGIVMPTSFVVLTKFTGDFSFDTEPDSVAEKSYLFVK